MGLEPHCRPRCTAASQEGAAGDVRQTRLNRERFPAQLANALTVLNGWAYLAQSSTCRANQQRYLDAIKQTLYQLTQLLQQQQGR